MKLSLLHGLAMLGALAPVLSAEEPAGLAGQSESAAIDPAAEIARYGSDDWKLVWSDEFDREGLPDPQKWGYKKGLVRNKEKQFYTEARAENARVADGQLLITALREPWEGAQYTSASLTTQNQFTFTYGKIEIRAKVPPGRGVWPALWTLGANKPQVRWPGCGEIDLMEFVGFRPDKFFFNVHTRAFNHNKKNQKGTGVSSPDAWKDFHLFGLLWNRERLVWFMDGKPVFAFANDGGDVDHWPFDQPQFLIMNLAIGGSWGGIGGIDDSIFPATMKVDYVRIWSGK